ncbi:hypothetical protein EVAR_19402_1 [Eumeta japonica]|uniref:Uncharacterized protein n=1 Tax=Eumeta variegata TaxID=151549 RepID=A0A4C1TRI5_EUMVA|nr:hypothetical protein EVAR_19402_1 [Eumeta japonica]
MRVCINVNAARNAGVGTAIRAKEGCMFQDFANEKRGSEFWGAFLGARVNYARKVFLEFLRRLPRVMRFTGKRADDEGIEAVINVLKNHLNGNPTLIIGYYFRTPTNKVRNENVKVLKLRMASVVHLQFRVFEGQKSLRAINRVGGYRCPWTLAIPEESARIAGLFDRRMISDTVVRDGEEGREHDYLHHTHSSGGFAPRALFGLANESSSRQRRVGSRITVFGPVSKASKYEIKPNSSELKAITTAEQCNTKHSHYNIKALEVPKSTNRGQTAPAGNKLNSFRKEEKLRKVPKNSEGEGGSHEAIAGCVRRGSGCA